VEFLRPSTKFKDGKAYIDITWDDLFPEEPYCYTGKSIKDDSHALGRLRRKLFADEEPDYPEPNRLVKSIEHTIIIIDSDED
jgi:hypothetical protein